MKRTTILTALCALSFTANAQFKIHSNGNIGFKTSIPLSPISLNTVGSSSYFMSYKGDKCGLKFQSENRTNCAQFRLVPHEGDAFSIGVQSYVTFDSDIQNGRGIGVLGYCSGKEQLIGVQGAIRTSDSDIQKGAGILGATSIYTSPLDGIYAGFFYGDVKTKGNLIVTGTVQGTILGTSATSANNSLMRNNVDAKNKTIDQLFPLSLCTYTNKQIETNYNIKSSENLCSDDEEAIEMAQPLKEENSYLEQQNYKKTHYALDADQLEKSFPDLVYEKEDGSKVINYMEMIPILVQSINELNAEIAKLKGTETEETTFKAPSVTKITSTTASAAILKQNTPNPFSERTTIGFTLPTGAQNAYIYIFDMQGKMQKQVAVDASMQSITINGYELSAGMYIYSLVVNGKEVDTKRMILSK